MMDALIGGMESYAAAYLEDIVVFSENWGEHLKHVRHVLESLRSAGLTTNPRKCKFAMVRCVYLGHIVGSGLVQPEEGKVAAIRTFPTPQSKQQVRAFLGLAGYYRKFIPNFSATAAALTDLTRKVCPNSVKWNGECELAFQTIRICLCSSPVLCAPNFSKAFILQTDASNRGIGGILSQLDEENIDRPVAYYSRKLLPREERYSTVEKECLAIKYAVEAFYTYLLGREFTIQTDHSALKWLDNFKDSNSRLTRWSLALQPYHYRIIYRAGEVNANADGLSRAWHSDMNLSEEGKGSVKKPVMSENGTIQAQ